MGHISENELWIFEHICILSYYLHATRCWITDVVFCLCWRCLFALFVAELRALPNWKASGKFFWDDNCVFDKNEIESPHSTQSTTECANACLANTECDHFTWSSWDNMCYLKKGSWPGNNPTPLANAQCGFIPVRPGPQWKTTGNFLWDDNCVFDRNEIQEPYTAESTQECANHCFANSECGHFTWTRWDRMCYLKKGQWPGNKPTPLPNAQCGYIPSRPSPTWPFWTDNGNAVFGSDCDYPTNGYSISPQNDESINTCIQRCIDSITWTSDPCTHFTLLGRECLLKHKWSFDLTPGGSKNPVYYANMKCGYIKDRVAR